MENTIKCPVCGIENEAKRVTCKVCKESLHVKKRGGESVEGNSAPPPEEKTKEAPPVEPKKDPKKKTEPASKEPAPAKAKDQKPKRTIKRRKKVPKTFDTEPRFFVFSEGKLIAVNVRMLVSKSIPTKELDERERSLISLWNRNKDLLSG